MMPCSAIRYGKMPLCQPPQAMALSRGGVAGGATSANPTSCDIETP